MEEDKVKAYVLSLLNRQIVSFYKRNLNFLSEIKFEHSSMLDKLLALIPPEELKKIDYFNDDRYNLYRKKILDMGNDLIREIESSMEKVDISLKPLTLGQIPTKKITIEGGTGTNKIKVKGKLI